MTRRPRLATFVGALALALAPLSTASATPAVVGGDVGFAGCATTLPPAPAFAVVGVTNGTPFSQNPCLANELTWAASTGTPAAFYLNTANPGPAHSMHWPTQQTPQPCDGSNSLACAYDYGWNAAQSGVADLSGVAPSLTLSSTTWWLDVERANSWESLEADYGPSAASLASDGAAVAGEVAYLESLGVASVGLYASSADWPVIVGPTPSLSSLPLWAPGYTSLANAEVGCGEASVTGGPVTLTQFASGGVDSDVACRSVAPGSLTQSLRFTSSAPASATVGSSYPVSASATSGLAVTLAIDPSSTSSCSLRGNLVTFNAPGPCVVVAQQSGNTVVAPAPSQSQTIVVTAASPSTVRISFSARVTTISGSNAQQLGRFASSLPAGAHLVLTMGRGASPALATARVHAITAFLAKRKNVNVTVHLVAGPAVATLRVL